MTRSKIILLAAQGKPNKEIALELGVSRKMVGLWRARFVENRMAGIERMRLEIQWSFGQFHKDPIFYRDGSIRHDNKTRQRQSPENMSRAERGKPWSWETWSVGPVGKVLDPAFIYYETSNGLTSDGNIAWVRP